MFDLIIFLIGFVFIVFFCIFLYNGGTIYDLITFANFDSIYKKIDDDIYSALHNSNAVVEYNIAPSQIYVYKTSDDVVSFDPLLNQITITQQDKTRTVLNVEKDIGRMVSLFASLNRTFPYTPFNMST